MEARLSTLHVALEIELNLTLKKFRIWLVNNIVRASTTAFAKWICKKM